ncbi:MAG TPA: UDP-glucose 4-epimerase GalE, partial [Blastocatellia bacterium]|nr:UDP-glucose 4-epimerase GalE [Blastocatellia bacterium]
YRNNTANSLALLEEMLAASLHLFVFSSTAAVYGLPVTLPIEEGHSTRPISPYGSSKLMTETMLAAIGRAHDFRFVCFRYFNASGADPGGLIGENRTRETHLIPLALKTALGDSECLSIFGDDYPTADGTCIRDYVHVGDIARAHVLALQYLISGGTSDTFNLGNGAGYSVKEVIKASEQVSGRRIPTRVLPPRLGDPPVLVSDSAKANRILTWQPAFPRLDEIIRDAWRWHSRFYSNPEHAHSA